MTEGLGLLVALAVAVALTPGFLIQAKSRRSLVLRAAAIAVLYTLLSAVALYLAFGLKVSCSGRDECIRSAIDLSFYSWIAMPVLFVLGWGSFVVCGLIAAARVRHATGTARSD